MKVFEVLDHEFELRFANIVITTVVLNEPRYNEHLLKNIFFICFVSFTV